MLNASVKEETSGCMSDYNTTRTQRSSSQLPPLPLGCGPSQEDASTGADGQHRPHPNNQHTIFLFINESEEDSEGERWSERESERVRERDGVRGRAKE